MPDDLETTETFVETEFLRGDKWLPLVLVRQSELKDPATQYRHRKVIYHTSHDYGPWVDGRSSL